MRANPGLLILREGTILGKWNFRYAPKVSEINSNLISYLIDKNRLSGERYNVILIALAILVFYSLVFRFISTNEKTEK